jgi:hypothetical protein
VDVIEWSCKFSSKFLLSVQVELVYQVPYVAYFPSIGIELKVGGLVQVRGVSLSALVVRAKINSKCAMEIYHFMLPTNDGIRV